MQGTVSTDRPLRATDAALEAHFGLSSFRPWQREAIDAVLAGEPTLVVAPTGGGKSLTYQFPAVLLGGTSVVVSPLIALMEDQVRSLEARDIPATFLASTLPQDEIASRETRLKNGDFRLVFVAPERLASRRLVALLKSLNPPLVAIDEAHCISQWGHDFRPDYLRIGDVVRELNPAHLLACTATATPRVREEITERLSPDMRVILRGFARPNLHLSAAMLDGKKAIQKRLLRALKAALGSTSSPKGAAIVYAATRRNTERYAEVLSDKGYRAEAYHGGMEADDRASVARRFSEGDLDIVVATNAFGMGIDRPDIRAVVHVQAPGSIEAYYQEVGRAGRDGEAAAGLLLMSTADFGLRRRLIERAWDDGPKPDKARVSQQWQMFLDLVRYAEAGSCRQDFILSYFGDDEELFGGCGNCDCCDALAKNEVQAAVDMSTFVNSDEDNTTIRKALSGVGRARGRIGLKAIADMLAGKANKTLLRNGMTSLSTFGILRDKSVSWIVALLRRLIAARYVMIDAQQFPCLHLTPLGLAVVRGDEPSRVLLPTKKIESEQKNRGKSSSKSNSIDLGDDDQALFEALRQKRQELAKSDSVPAYVICSNRTLAAICAARPRSQNDLLEVNGMGPVKVERYGDALLETVSENLT